MSDIKPEWVQEGDEWVVTIDATTYRASYDKAFGQAGAYYVQGGTLSSEYRSLRRCLQAVLDHEASKCGSALHTHQGRA
ncbi:hypothetical protein OH779_14555 [Actinacidiphila glaucinigra]|uniref:hypothetical protein n=1 Tax=Actinacidiphila glaucinigra TaxID=235986 RepID=UPI00386B71FF